MISRHAYRAQRLVEDNVEIANRLNTTWSELSMKIQRLGGNRAVMNGLLTLMSFMARDNAQLRMVNEKMMFISSHITKPEHIKPYITVLTNNLAQPHPVSIEPEFNRAQEILLLPHSELPSE